MPAAWGAVLWSAVAAVITGRECDGADRTVAAVVCECLAMSRAGSTGEVWRMSRVSRVVHRHLPPGSKGCLRGCLAMSRVVSHCLAPFQESLHFAIRPIPAPCHLDQSITCTVFLMNSLAEPLALAKTAKNLKLLLQELATARFRISRRSLIQDSSPQPVNNPVSESGQGILNQAAARNLPRQNWLLCK